MDWDPPVGCNVKYFVLMTLVVIMLMPRFRGGKLVSISPERGIFTEYRMRSYHIPLRHLLGLLTAYGGTEDSVIRLCLISIRESIIVYAGFSTEIRSNLRTLCKVPVIVPMLPRTCTRLLVNQSNDY